MTKEEALRLALEAMKINNKAWKLLADSGDAGNWEAEEQGYYQLNEQAINAIKEALETKDEPFEYWNAVGWFGYDTGLRLWFEADKNDDGAIPLYKNALEMANRALETKDATVQVSPFEFVEMVMEKEHLIGQPIFWAQWPNKEKNT